MDAGKRSVLQQEHRAAQRVSGERESEADMLCSNKRLTDELLCDRLLLSIYQADSTCITNAGTEWGGNAILLDTITPLRCSPVNLSQPEIYTHTHPGVNVLEACRW